jgi:hypothetical protein
MVEMQTSDIKEARKRAEEMLLPLEGIAGISHREDPPRIIVYIEHEKYKNKVPDMISGFKTEVIVIGKIKILSLLYLKNLSYFSCILNPFAGLLR